MFSIPQVLCLNVSYDADNIKTKQLLLLTIKFFFMALKTKFIKFLTYPVFRLQTSDL